jgi:small multidrug resistance pump
MAILLLLVAIAIEVVSTALLPRTDGFRHAGWSVVVMVGYIGSIGLLSIVVRTVPVSIAYALWSGVGTALVAVIGMTFLGESVSWLKVLSLALIVAGVVGLNVSGAH